MKRSRSRWQADFFTGLAVVLPVVVSVVVVFWLFFTVSNVTDTLLIFVPRRITHKGGGTGPIYWYWSLAALGLALVLTTMLGRFARNYIGRKAIRLVDGIFLQVPLLNKIYGTVKQVNQAFTSSSKSSFKQVVLLQFPKNGLYSIGFVTGEQHPEVQVKTKERVVSVFVPTTPNPTTGFLVLAPEEGLTKLDMSVADGIKLILSLGSVAPDYAPLPGGIRAQLVIPEAEPEVEAALK